MKHLRALVLATLLLTSGAAFAQNLFVGGSLSGFGGEFGEAESEYNGLFVGGQLGAYNVVGGRFGARVTADFSFSPDPGVLSVSGDVLVSSSGSTNLYGGAGFGILSSSGGAEPFVKVFGVTKFGAGPVGIFLEGASAYVFQSGTLGISGHLGVIFGF